MAHSLGSGDQRHVSSDPSLTSSGGDAPGSGQDSVARRRSFITNFVLLFVTLSIAALAFLPVWTARRVDRIDLEIRNTLERARDLNNEFMRQNVQAMARIQGLFETSDPLARQQNLDSYRAHADTARMAYEELRGIASSVDQELELETIALRDRSEDWYASFGVLLRGEVAVSDFERDVGREQADYRNLLDRGSAMDRVLAGYIEAARAEADAAVSRQWRIGTLLLLLGMLSVFAVFYVARETHKLTRESEQRRRTAVGARREADAVLAGTGDGVIGIDLEGNCTFVNRAAAEMLQRSAPSLLGRSLHETVHHSRPDGSAYPSDECPLVGALDMDRATPPIEETFVRGDGSHFPVQVFSRPLVDGVEVRGAVLSFVDMTEIRDAERRLKDALRAREEIVGIVSHDLRNPVGTVTLAADLLLDVPLPPEKRREQLEVIKRQGKHMERLIRDLLDVTRIEAGTLPIRPSPEPIDALVHEALQDARTLAEQKNIVLRAEVDPGLPLVRADRGRILQVFSNLVGNAIKYTPDGGRVTLSACRQNGAVRVAVTDTGRGIAQEDTKRVFGRFWQVGRGSAGIGVGLGLAIVKGIVEAHDGRVWVESQPGAGSTFYFTLPALGGDAPLDLGAPINA